MANFGDFLQRYVNSSYDELLFFANHSLADIIDEVQKIFKNDDDTAQVLLTVVAACIGVDGKLSSLEHKFICDILELESTYEETMGVVSSLGGEKAEEFVDKLADALPAEKKAALVTLCLSFLAVDETISRDEVAFVCKLIEE